MEDKKITQPTAWLAKEKGWSQDFVESGKIFTTQSLLQKWLREKYNTHIVVISIWGWDWAGDSGALLGYGFYVYRTWREKVKILLAQLESEETPYSDYEEALEVALVKALNLIKVKKFPSFWYESNAAWGRVNSLEELADIAKLCIDGTSTLLDVNHFLERSKQVKDSEELNFGLRIEHKSEFSLKKFLEENDLLENFLALFD